MKLINHWDKANEAATAGDKNAVRAMLIDEMERMDEDNFTDATFNEEDIDDRVMAAGKKWAAEIEGAAIELAAGNDAGALFHVESANNIESYFGDNPNTAHLLSAAQWLNLGEN